jgi:signal transduction histidine kinase
LTRDDALAALSAESAHERLKGARFLARNAQASDLLVLRQARRGETVSYVKAALEAALARVSDLNRADETPAEVSDATLLRAKREAVEWVAGMLLHEIATPIGRVSFAASREVPNFERSNTKSRLDSLKQIFSAIEHLKGAASPPKPQEFDLAELVKKIVADEAGPRREDVSIEGPEPFLVNTDQSMLSFAVVNGLRNALEAVEPGTMHSVVLTWNETDIDYWLAITDSGPGLPGAAEPAFEIGTSSKRNHIGFGLAIARQAMESIGGKVLLTSPTSGGAVYELRWER